MSLTKLIKKQITRAINDDHKMNNLKSRTT